MAKKASKSDKADKAPAKAAQPARAERKSWLDPKTHHPLIEDYARQLESFVQTMADGRVDDAEIDAQEKRLIQLMEEIEPQLDDALHAKVTQLLCEQAAYDLMQMVKMMQDERPRVALNL